MYNWSYKKKMLPYTSTHSVDRRTWHLNAFTSRLMEIKHKSGTQKWQKLNIDLTKKLNFYARRNKIWKNNCINCIWNAQNTIKCKIYCIFFGYILWVYAHVSQMHDTHNFSCVPLFIYCVNCAKHQPKAMKWEHIPEPNVWFEKLTFKLSVLEYFTSAFAIWITVILFYFIIFWLLQLGSSSRWPIIATLTFK